MALNITTGAGSLVSIGMSLGDVSTLYALGRRYGTWVTAHSGDVEFLDLLQSDELDILRRRGMIDVARFNKRWAQRVRLLMNGRPLELAGKKAADIVGPLSRFTASMVAVVAALDGFMSYTVLRDVIKRLLKELLRTTEYGEDVLTSQLGDRVNAWRSAAYVRSLSLTVQTMRQDMVASHKVLNGYMPAGDAGEMAEFLFWRSAEAMEAIRSGAIKSSLTRENLLVILATLLFSHPVDIPVFNQRSSCLGIVGKRALLVNSLVTKSDTVEDVGKFTLLDVDIGGVPCNADGLVRPGEAPNLESDWFDFALTKPKRINPKGPISDFTKHLEPDWDVDPDTVLLVMRYRGRRVATINPSVADKLICEYYVGPVENAAPQQEVPVGVEYTVENFLSGKALFSNDNAVKVVVQSKDMPGMRYATVGSFPRLPRRPRDDLDLNKPLVALVSNCVVAATKEYTRVIVA